MAAPALLGWHPGELAIQRKLGYADTVSDAWARVSSFMPEQHRLFHTSNLPFIPMTTLDAEGRPWASIVAGPTGDIGFVNSPDPRTLVINARLWDGDPLLDIARAWITSKHQTAVAERFLTAGLGIEFSTRRRNKFAGLIRRVTCQRDLEYQIDLNVSQTIG